MGSSEVDKCSHSTRHVPEERIGNAVVALVSVVVPCFNGAQYLPSLAVNLTAARSEAHEIIFVDDGSVDGSAELFAELMPDAIIIRQKNAGVSAARNTGVLAATGDFVQLLDADDEILPGKLSQQAAFAIKNNCDVVYSDWQMVVVTGQQVIFEPIQSKSMPAEPVEALLSGWWVPPHAYLIRRSSYLEVGGSDTRIINAQDYDLVLRLAISGKKFGHLRGFFSKYYRYEHVTSLARGPRRQYWRDYEIATENAISIMKALGDFTPTRRLAAARKMHVVARSVYALDPDWFESLVGKIYTIYPKFLPTQPRLYALVARLLGLRQAEWLAHRLRNSRQYLRSK